MSNDNNTKQPATPDQSKKIEKKLPAIEPATVEEVPASDLDDAAGGFTDCKGSCYATSVAPVV